MQHGEMFHVEHFPIVPHGTFLKEGEYMTMKELSTMCRNWRIGRGITQAEIAKKSGTTVQAVSAFECGGCNSLRIYCAYLDAGFSSVHGDGAVLMEGAFKCGETT